MKNGIHQPEVVLTWYFHLFLMDIQGPLIYINKIYQFMNKLGDFKYLECVWYCGNCYGCGLKKIVL